jgi:threonine dehydrogenase-like Zn-dependent dehydrogenase
MLALWLEDQKLALRDDLDAPRPAPNESRVRVRCAGICNTDLELLRGYYPFTGIPGHEFVGEVEQGPSELRGRRVVGEINAVCGECSTCRAGRTTHCERRTVLGIVGRHGAFAEYLTLPSANLHLVPDGVPDEVAVFTEPLAAALEIQQQIDITSDDRVLVAGDGKLGQLIARTLVSTGCELRVIGRRAEKLAMLERAGIHCVAEDEIEQRSFDVAIECTGNPDGFDLARRALRPRGTLVLKSTYAAKLIVDAASLVVDEITLVGSRCGPFGPALQMLSEGTIDPSGLVHGRYPLKHVVAAFERAREPDALKILVDMT